jgi:predicted SnoaL-like aldol condensation-catalyzing enzyme
MSDLKEKAKKYVEALQHKDLQSVSSFFHSEIVLDDNVYKKVKGKKAVVDVYHDFIKKHPQWSYKTLCVTEEGNITVIECEQVFDGKKYRGVEILDWKDGLIKENHCYLCEWHPT